MNGIPRALQSIARAALLAAAALQAPAALAQLSGATVTHGSATFAHSGSLTAVTASNNAVIQYSGFSIQAGQTVQFIQPSASSKVLNWVSGSMPTNIYGTLLGNGQVYIANAAGVYFGAGSYVNVGALYAVAGSISTQDFLAGTNRFTGATGAVVNDGAIEAQTVALVGQAVANHGSILAPDGFITLAAGNSVYLAEPGSAVFVTAPLAASHGGTGVENTGRIDAGRGHALLAAGDLYSLAISQSGTVRGAKVTVDGGDGSVLVAGTLDASQRGAGQVGGQVVVEGGSVELAPTASLDASGTSGGGTILVGGGRHGDDPAVRDAATTRVDPGATLTADALGAGNGGQVVVWSQDQTDFGGLISARGDATSGLGGSAEVSSGQLLQYFGQTDLGASAGHMGTLLLDPSNITIAATGTDSPTALEGFTDTPGAPTTIMASALATALNNANITLQANNNISITAAVDASGNAQDGNLILQAGNSITIGASVKLLGSFSATANDPGAVDANRLAGTATLSMTDGTAITSTVGGNIALMMGSGPATNHTSGDITVATLSTTGGNILVSNAGPTAGGNILGTATSSLTAATIALNVADTGGTIGTGVAPIALVAGNVAAHSVDGGIFLQQTGSALTIGGAVLGSLTGISSGGGPITVSTASPLTVAEAVSSGGGAITLTSSTASFGAIPISAGAGTITLLPSTDASVINLGTGVTGYALSAAALGDLTASTVVIGRPTGTGAITASDLDLSGNGYGLTLQGTSSPLTLGALALGSTKTLDLAPGGTTTASGAVTAGTVDLTGATSFSGPLTATSLNVGAGAYAVSLLGTGTTVTNAVTFANTGGLTIGSADADTYGFAGGFTSTAGATTLRGVISSTNSAIDAGAVTLAGDTSLSTGTAGLMLGAVTGATFDLTVVHSGALTTGTVSGLGALTQANAATGPTIFSGNVSATSASLAGTTFSGHGFTTSSGALAIVNSGTASFSGNLNVATGLSASGAVSFGGSQIVAGPITLSHGLTLTGATVLLKSTSGATTLGSVAAGAANVTLEGDGLTLGGGANSFVVTGALTIEPTILTTTIGVNGGSGSLNLGTTNLAAIKPGFSSLTIGQDTDTGAIAATGPLSFGVPLSILGTGASLALSGSINDTASVTIDVPTTLSGASATLAAGTGTLTLGSVGAGSTNLTLQADHLSLGGAASLTGSASLTIEPTTLTTSIGINGGAGTLAIDQTAIGAGFSSLTIGQAAGTGTITASGSLSFSEALTVRGAGGSFVLGGNLSSTSSIDVAVPMSLTGASASLDAGSGILTLGSVAAGSTNLILQADVLTLGGANSLVETGALTIEPSGPGTTIGINGGAGTLNLGPANLAAIKAGFASLTIGQAGDTGAVTLSGPMILNAPFTVLGTGAAFNLSSTLSSSSSIDIETGTASLSNSGLSTSGHNLTLAGTTTITGGATTLDAGSATLTLGGVAAGTTPLTLEADHLTLGAANSLAGTGALTIEPSSPTTTIGLNGGAGTLDLGSANLAAIKAGFASLTLGQAGDTGAITAIGPFSVAEPFTVLGTGAAFSISGGALSGTGPASVTLNTGSVALASSGITTAGQPITVSGALTISGTATTLDSGSGTLTLAGVNAGTTPLTLEADHLTLGVANSLAGTGALTIEPSSPATTIGLNGGAGTLDLGGTNLAAIKAGFASLTIGQAGDTGAITADGPFSVAEPFTILGSGAAFSISGGALTGTGTASITIDTSLAALANSGITTSGQPITVTGSTTVSGASTTLNSGGATLTLGAVNSGSGNLTLEGNGLMLTGGALSLSGTGNLTIEPGTANATIGIDGGAGTLQITAADIAAISSTFANLTIGRSDGTGAIDLRGSAWAEPLIVMTLTGPVFLQGTLTTAGHGLTITAPAVTLDADTTVSTSGGTLSFSGSINGLAPGAQALSLLGGSGTVSVGGSIGATNPLSSLTLTSGGSLSQGGAWSAGTLDVTTSGAAISLGNAGNRFTGTVSLTGTGTTAATIADADPLQFGNVSLAVGASTLVASSGGSITQPTGSIDVNSTTTLTATVPGSNITLLNGANVFNGTISVTNNLNVVDLGLGNATLTAALPVLPSGLASLALNFPNSSVTLPGLTLSGPLTVTTGGGDLTQSGPLVVTGLTTLSSGATHDIVMNNPSNNFAGSIVVTSARNATITEILPLTLGGLSVSGNLTLSAPSITVGQAVTTGGTLSFNGVTTVVQDIHANGISFTGTTLLTGTVDQTIDSGTGTLMSSGGILNKTGAGSLTLSGQAIDVAGVSVATGSLTVSDPITATGDLLANGINLLSTTTLDGPVTQNINAHGSPLDATGLVAKSGGGDLYLTGSMLNLNGGVTSTGLIAFLGPLTFSGDLISQGLTLGMLTLTGTGDQTLGAGTGVLTLTGTVSKPSGNLILDGGAGIDIQNTLSLGGSLTVNGPSTVAGDITASGITLAGAATLTAGGLQQLNAGAGALTIGGALSKPTGDLTLTGGGGVSIGGAANVGGALTVHGLFTLAGDAVADGLAFSGATLNGTDQTLSGGSGSLVSTGDITKTTGGTLTLGGAAVTVSGGVQSAGPVIFAGPATVTGAVAGQGVTFLASADFTGGGVQTVSSGGGPLLSTGVTLADPSGSLTFQGASGQLGSVTVAGVFADDLLTSTLNGTYTATSFAFANTFMIAGDSAFNGPVSLGTGFDTAGHNLTFGGPVTLTQNITINTGGQTVTFSSTLDGGVALDLDIGSGGSVRLLGETGGISPLASLTTDGAGTLFVGGNITTNGHSQTYGTPVVLAGNTVFTELDAGGEITFNGTLDAAQPGGASVSVVSPGTMTFGGAVGQQAALSGLKTEGGGLTVLSGGTVVTEGPQSYGGGVMLGKDADLDTNGSSLDLQAIDGNGQNLTIDAGVGAGATTVHGDVTNLGSGTGAALTVAPGVTGALAFGGTLAANGALSIPAAVATSFAGDVTLGNGGGSTQVLGTVQLAGLTFSSYNDLTLGKVTLSGGPVTLSSQNGGAVALGSVDGPEALTVTTTGQTTFGGDVGGQAALASLTTGGGASLGGNVHTSGDQVFGGAVSLAGGGNAALTADQGKISVGGALTKSGAGNLALTSGTSVAVQGDVTLGAGALTLDAPALSLGGNAAADGFTATHALTLTGTGAQTLAAGAGPFGAAGITKASGSLSLTGGTATLGGNVSTSNAGLTLDFTGITLGSDVALASAGGDLMVTGPISGAHALKVDAGGGKATVVDAVGSASGGLTSFAANGGSISLADVYTSGDQAYTYSPAGLLLLNGNTYQASAGNIDLNSTGSARTVIPNVATIAKPNAGDLAISASGNVTMGLYEKLSVSGGNLDLKAGGVATLSDISVAGALVAQATSYVLLTRGPGTVLVDTGNTTDLGLDFVAGTIAFNGSDGTMVSGSKITFSATSPSSTYTVRFATADGKADIPLYPGFSFYTLPSSYFDGALITSLLFGPLDNAYLSLRAIGFVRANVDTALPPASPAPPEQVNIVYEVPAALREDLVKLGIFARADSDLELAPFDPAAPVYDATIKSEDRSPELFEVADARISSQQAVAAIRLYRQIFEERTPDGRIHNRIDQIQRLLASAFGEYRRESGSTDPVGFRRYLEAKGGPALTYLNQLRSLLQRIGQMGLTPNEFSISKTYVLRSIRIPGLPLQALREAVDPEGSGPTGKLVAAR